VNTLTDVLIEIIRLVPAREEATVSKMVSIVEGAREHLDTFVKNLEATQETAETTADATAQTPTVSGL
jgi:hypothetical protein